MAAPAAARAAPGAVKAAPVPDGTAQSVTTAYVTTGSCAYGVCFDVTTAYVTTGSCAYGVCFDVAAKDQPVTVTGLYTASSPGLNWGQGGKVRIKIFATKGTSRGKELRKGAWTQVGNDDTATLPMVSWLDGDKAEYGRVDLQSPVLVPAGETYGFLVHTSDLYGLVTSTGAGAGGSMEMWDEDEMGGAFRVGDPIGEDANIRVACGYEIGDRIFEEFDGVALPQ
ncbi:hypothetical protein T484DRAFT_1781725, partial [Baffinella frigidus]